MTQVVYIDVLFVINLVVNYFILLATRQAVRAGASRWRLIGGAALGALYSMIIFFPNLPWFVTMLAKLVFAVSIVLATFGLVARRRFIKLLAYFYIISFAFAGMMMAFWYLAAPPGMAIHNGVLYINISPLVLILTSAAAYVLFGLAQRFFGTSRRNTMCKVRITVGGNTVTVDALIDSGHALKESFSGRPVIVCEYKAVESLIPEPLKALFAEGGGAETAEGFEGHSDWIRRYRMIPCNTVAGTGLLPAFRADRTEVLEHGKNGEISGAYIAVSGQSLSGGAYHALLSPEAV